MTAITVTITINLVNFQVVIDLLNLILELDPSVLGPVDGSKLMGDILIDLLDIDLAISEVHIIIVIFITIVVVIIIAYGSKWKAFPHIYIDQP